MLPIVCDVFSVVQLANLLYNELPELLSKERLTYRRQPVHVCNDRSGFG